MSSFEKNGLKKISLGVVIEALRVSKQYLIYKIYLIGRIDILSLPIYQRCLSKTIKF